MAICQFCRQSFKSDLAVRQHQAQSVTSGCRQKRDTFWDNLWEARKARMNRYLHDVAAVDNFPADSASSEEMQVDDNLLDHQLHDNLPTEEHPESNDQDATLPRRARVDEIQDEELEYPRAKYTQEWPPEKGAGLAYQDSKTQFEQIRDDQILKGDEIYGPFKGEDEWELVKWLIKNVGHTQAEKFLKLPIIQSRVNPSFHNKDALLNHIDTLPSGVDWQCEDIELTGDVPDQDGNLLSEKLELWFRDPLDCIQELFNNPVFRDVMKEGHMRATSEIWTADWWWNIQEKLAMGATVAPIILSSDKTKLSQFRGDKSAWPLYLTIGNIAKDVRRKVSSHATILVGYLPVAKLDSFSDKTCSAVKYRLFHYCMKKILASVAKAGQTGVVMTCADGLQRAIWPIVAAYIADYPEQCLVACCMENRCPMCQVPPERRGEHETHLKRDEQETLSFLAGVDAGMNDPHTKEKFKELGLRPVYPPFWQDLPHSDVFQWFTPDLLHQLHKGVFKDHLVKWCMTLVGPDEVDARFHSMSQVTGLRHFEHGISAVSQWTGSEHKEMEKVFLGLVMGCADAHVVKAVCAVIDFIYYASLHSHTTQTLAALEHALDDFHAHKDIFIELGARNQDHFNIPKIHAMKHYVAMIKQFGSADGFNTESPERLHIDYAKDAYRASNHKDYLCQMVTWLRRQEAVDRFTQYLEWSEHGVLDGHDTTLDKVEGEDPECVTVIEQPAESVLDSFVGYKVAKKHPRALLAVCASDIMSQHNAPRFLECVSTFLQSRGCTFTPRPFDGFDLYARLSVNLPHIPATGTRHSKNIIRASPPVPAHGRCAAQPARLDFALVQTGETNNSTVGTPLEGLRIAHIRAIFTLPHYYPARTQHPLAYIEWFTPFHRKDQDSGLYIVSASTRMHQPYGEIITIDRIAQNCHLIPVFGCKMDSRWTAKNVTELYHRDLCGPTELYVDTPGLPSSTEKDRSYSKNVTFADVFGLMCLLSVGA
ncbi:hypothetical protein BKA93DRAFT_844890 [Sparassis latifolia]